MTRTPITNAFQLIVLLVLFGCGCGAGSKYQPSSEPSVDNFVSMAASDWEIRYSSGMPAHPEPVNGEWFFDFPNAPNTVNYIQVPYHQTVAHSSVTIAYRIDAEGADYYQSGLQDTNPATVNLFLERTGDDLTDKNKFYYRWWPSGANLYKDSLPTANGSTTTTVSIPLTYDQWTPVEGATDAAQFQSMLDNLGWVGITFGGQYFRGHGVGVAAGKARFTLLSYSIQ